MTAPSWGTVKLLRNMLDCENLRRHVWLACAWSSLVEGDEGWIRPSKKLLCLCSTQKNNATHSWHNSKVVWLLGWSSCSSPSTKELHGLCLWGFLAGLCTIFSFIIWWFFMRLFIQKSTLFIELQWSSLFWWKKSVPLHNIKSKFIFAAKKTSQFSINSWLEPFWGLAR